MTTLILAFSFDSQTISEKVSRLVRLRQDTGHRRTFGGGIDPASAARNPLIGIRFDNFPQIAVHIVESPWVGKVGTHGGQMSRFVVQCGLGIVIAEQAPVGEVGVHDE